MIKDILVHLDGSADDESGFNMRRRSQPIPGPSDGGLHKSPRRSCRVHATRCRSGCIPGNGGLRRGGTPQGNIIQQRLAERFWRLSIPNEIRRVDGTPSQLVDRAASEARWSDLFVASRPYHGNGSAKWDELFEAVLFESGRAIYVVPPGRKPAESIRRILVAWRDTRKPLVRWLRRCPYRKGNPDRRPARRRGDRHDGRKRAPEMDIARHLDRHGTKIEVHMPESGDRAVSEVILDQARRISADLVVMGGYGHSRAREWVLGGATLEVLENSEFPVLMAH